jgi:predicted transposase YdaD
VVLFAGRSLEPAPAPPYQPLIDAGLIRRFYLDEMHEFANQPLGLSILGLIGRAESQAPEAARNLVARAKSEIGDAELRVDLIELIETIVLYKLPRLNREEIQTMLQIHDLRESRVYQEALEEGRKEGLARAIAKLAAKKMTPDEIAALLEVDIEFVRETLNGRTDGGS